MEITARKDVLRRWEELEFVDFLGSKAALLEIEGGGGAPESTVVLAIEYAPNFWIAPHHHYCGHVEIILEGSLRIGDHWEYPGDTRVVPAGYSYGPIQAGPGGCKGLEVFPERRAIIPVVDDPEAVASHEGDAEHLRRQLMRLLKL